MVLVVSCTPLEFKDRFLDSSQFFLTNCSMLTAIFIVYFICYYLFISVFLDRAS